MKYFFVTVCVVALANILAPAAAYPASFSRAHFEESVNEVGVQLINDTSDVTLRLVHLIIDSGVLRQSERAEWQGFINKWEGTKLDKHNMYEFQSDMTELPVQEVRSRLDDRTKATIGELGLNFGQRTIEKVDNLKDQVRAEIDNTSNYYEKQELLEVNRVLTMVGSLLRRKIEKLREKLSQ